MIAPGFAPRERRLAGAAAAGILAACATARGPAPAAGPDTRAAPRPAYSPAALERLTASMSPSMLWLASRLAADRGSDVAGRAEGWAILDVTTAPSLGLGPLSRDEAQRLNAWLPTPPGRTFPVDPFVLKVKGPERQRALMCLTQAIYYEAALEPTPGQEAVAQTILNRVRHPAFPKSICGVVYQGAQQVTGCQYSFTCDGSRDRPPMAVFWNRARDVAAHALDGFVADGVGTATSYHADYVFPRWGPTLVKIRQIGTHIFYRFPGPAGQSGAFHERYAGGEQKVSLAGPSPEAIAAARAAGLPPGGAPEPNSLVDANAAPAARGGGQMVYGRRAPTKDEIDRINAVLAAMDSRAPAPPAPAPSAAFSDRLPLGKPAPVP